MYAGSKEHCLEEYSPCNGSAEQVFTTVHPGNKTAQRSFYHHSKTQSFMIKFCSFKKVEISFMYDLNYSLKTTGSWITPSRFSILLFNIQLVKSDHPGLWVFKTCLQTTCIHLGSQAPALALWWWDRLHPPVILNWVSGRDGCMDGSIKCIKCF